jgi:sulfoxide reductase catalytic subunit YedY
MLIQKRDSGFVHPSSSEITAQTAYRGRRQLLSMLASGAAGAALASWAARDARASVRAPGKLAALSGGKSGVAGATTMEPLTDYKDASTYNNFYEFGLTNPIRPAMPIRSRCHRGRSKWRGWSRSLPSTPWKICSS